LCRYGLEIYKGARRFLLQDEEAVAAGDAAAVAEGEEAAPARPALVYQPGPCGNVGLYKLNGVDPELESAWFQPLRL
jgi:hypothetical protein